MSTSVNPKHRTFLSNDFNSKKTQTWAAISIGVVIFAFGIPIWWKTTEVYRASLPFDEISSLYEDKSLTVKVPILVKVPENADNVADILTNALKLDLNNDMKGQIKFLYSFDDMNSKSNKFTGIVIRLNVKSTEQMEAHVAKDGTITCTLPNTEKNTIDQLSLLIRDLIKDVIINEALLHHMVGNIYRTTHEDRHDRNLIKVVQANPKFELLFSLLCPEPQVQAATWDMEKDSEMFLTPMLNKLQHLFDFHVGSQILYYTAIPYKPKVKKDEQNKALYRYLTPQQLSLVINPIEGRLGSQVSSDPTLNFVVYLTEKKFTPLYIKTENGDLSKSNAFLVPRWGSMQFYNIKNISESNGLTRVDPQIFMSAFIPHLRILLGLQNNPYVGEQIIFEDAGYENIADWELNYLYRLRTVEHIASSIHTLHSLSKLLNQISNIVINDNIATEVYDAVESIIKAKGALKNGDLKTALKYSKKAFIASETAFFDPTLLELLYFPEDQKFAIYIPLFLPISLPILISLRYAFQRCRKKDFDEEEKEKTD
uniref:GPI transamidase component PIG-S-like n=1 Tax=Phallusia mammillata TaxID=59560 RepID=A0A6F9DPE7_9ASCI|nr:GPI transamidase component PIG-S-like [Phallusia mammillata]